MKSFSISKTKEAYSNPEMTSIEMGLVGSVLNNISNPGGEVPPIDPNEE